MAIFRCLQVFLLGTSVVSDVCASFGFGGGNDQVILNDIKVLTLRADHMTTGRRSSPVPQLKCIGGSAGCSAFKPQVVQCYNRGSDGYDIQWECKSDMDNDYRFGKIEVTCEGYSHPDDEYILKGSCGLEYTLDLTKEGTKKSGYQRQHSYYGNDGNHGNSYGYKRKSSGIGDWITLAIIGVIIYGIYRSCIATTSAHDSDNPDDGYPRQAGYGSGTGGNPPPPGFRPGYGSDSCSGSRGGGSRGGGHGTGRAGGGGGLGGGGFWSGAATGGMLGYLFGSRGNRGYGYGAPAYGRRGYGNSGFFGGGGGGFGGGGFGGSGGGFSGGGSSGTRTASGFGGTRRR